MYYVPDGTEMCGYYECKECGNRFLALQTGPQLVCPYCGEEPDMEVGPDEEMPVAAESAKLIQVVKGAEEVERMDTLLSLAVTGGDYAWIWKKGVSVKNKIFHTQDLCLRTNLRCAKAAQEWRFS